MYSTGIKNRTETTSRFEAQTETDAPEKRGNRDYFEVQMNLTYNL